MTIMYRGRRAVSVENDRLRVTILVEGGHLAEILDKQSGVNPLWTPKWPSIEPSGYGLSEHAIYGGPADGPLLAGIMGHNLCLDIFGGPSTEEAAAGLTAHGEASIVAVRHRCDRQHVDRARRLPARRIEVRAAPGVARDSVAVTETVTNVAACDRPIGWTQHVTLGPPFLEHGQTEFRTSATQSRVFETAFGAADYLVAGADFDWPNAPRIDGGVTDLQPLYRRRLLERLHGSSDGSFPGRCLLRRILPKRKISVRLPVAAE